MNSIGLRLKEERVRIGLSQDDFAAIAGVQRRAQGTYERGQRAPDAAYLSALAQHGIDVQYVLTGERRIDLKAELSMYGDAWEVLEEVLQANRKNMPADKKRQAAEALYQSVRAGDGEAERLANLIMKAA